MHNTTAARENAPRLFGALEGGGSKFVCAVGHSPMHVLERTIVPTTDAATTLVACVQFFREMQDQRGRITALGIACFGPLQLKPGATDHGCLLATPKPGWSGASIIAPFENALELPVALDTDVGAAALAEWRLGAGQNLGSLAYVTVGTGIGGAVAPTLRPDQRLMHAEMGHMPVRRDPRDAGFQGICPFHGDCLEGLACGLAIRARWGCDLASLPPDHPGRSIIAGYLGQLAASIVLFHAVERIVFGGGVMSDGCLLPMVRLATHQYLNGYAHPLQQQCQIDSFLVKPALGDGAAIAGAILLAQHHLASRRP